MLNSPNKTSGLIQGVEEAPVDNVQYARSNGVWKTVANPAKNIIINGDLEINQRGVLIVDTAVGAYGPDRWKKSTPTDMTQTVEDVMFEPGETYTLSYKVNSNWVEQQVTMPASGHYTTPHIPVGARKIQLERGTKKSDFEERDYLTELTLCQRYYLYFSSCTGACYFYPSEINIRRRIYQFSFPVVMHHAPASPQPNGSIEASFTPGAGFGAFYNANTGPDHCDIRGESTGNGNFAVSQIRLSAEI